MTLEYARSTMRWAGIVAAFAVLNLVAGMILGAVVGFTAREKACQSILSSSRSCGTDHPYIALGVGIALGALFTTGVLLMATNYAQMRASQVLDSAPAAPATREPGVTASTPPLREREIAHRHRTLIAIRVVVVLTVVGVAGVLILVLITG
jgi:hypothetical protein